MHCYNICVVAATTAEPNMVYVVPFAYGSDLLEYKLFPCGLPQHYILY